MTKKERIKQLIEDEGMSRKEALAWYKHMESDAEPTRTATIHLRLTADDKAKIEAATQAVGQSVSDFVRGAAVSEAKQVLSGVYGPVP